MSAPVIIVGVTGSIAAYKAADLVSKLVKREFEVHVVMTHGAQEFITPLTFQTLSKNAVITSVFEDARGWKPGHVDLGDRADLQLVAPATANIIAELAQGLAGNPIGEIALATLAPILIAPAMNGKMWRHAATQDNVKLLAARGAHFIGPEEGMLACGYEGLGRLWSVDGIAERAAEIVAQKNNKYFSCAGAPRSRLGKKSPRGFSIVRKTAWINESHAMCGLRGTNFFARVFLDHRARNEKFSVSARKNSLTIAGKFIRQHATHRVTAFINHSQKFPATRICGLKGGIIDGD